MRFRLRHLRRDQIQRQIRHAFLILLLFIRFHFRTRSTWRRSTLIRQDRGITGCLQHTIHVQIVPLPSARAHRRSDGRWPWQSTKATRNKNILKAIYAILKSTHLQVRIAHVLVPLQCHDQVRLQLFPKCRQHIIGIRPAATVCFLRNDNWKKET